MILRSIQSEPPLALSRLVRSRRNDSEVGSLSGFSLILETRVKFHFLLSRAQFTNAANRKALNGGALFQSPLRYSSSATQSVPFLIRLRETLHAEKGGCLAGPWIRRS